MSDPAPQRRQRRSRSQGPSLAKRIGVGLLIVGGFAASGGIGAGIYFLPAIKTAFNSLGQNAGYAPTSTADVSAVASPGATPAPTARPFPSGGAVVGADQPFTMLLLGSDNDTKFGPSTGAVLTQSMILARVDPAAKTVVMLSIPRDLYVPLSSGGTDKIDKAYLHGGAQAAIDTVQNNFRVRIDHWAWIGLEGLIKLIDQVGGIDIVATNPVIDDYYPADLTAANPFNFHRVFTVPGPQHLDGMLAMEYVRSRHGDLRGDFGRSARQQQVLLALRAKSKLLSFANLPDIAATIDSEFKTDVALTSVTNLLPLAGSIPLSSVTQVVLGPPYTSSEVIGSQDVLIPNWNLIRGVVSQYFPIS